MSGPAARKPSGWSRGRRRRPAAHGEVGEQTVVGVTVDPRVAPGTLTIDRWRSGSSGAAPSCSIRSGRIPWPASPGARGGKEASRSGRSCPPLHETGSRSSTARRRLTRTRAVSGCGVVRGHFGQRQFAGAGAGRPLRLFQPIRLEAHLQDGWDPGPTGSRGFWYCPRPRT